jgi:hypothetical protein
MGGVQELLVSKPAEGTLTLVCLKHTLSKCSLVKADSDFGRHIGSAGRDVSVLHSWNFFEVGSEQAHMYGIVNRNRERKIGWIIPDNEYRPSREVLSPNDPMKINEWQSTLHREAEASVVSVIRVFATIPVAEQTLRTERVVIRAAGCRGN